MTESHIENGSLTNWKNSVLIIRGLAESNQFTVENQNDRIDLCRAPRGRVD